MPTDDMHCSCAETPIWIPPLFTADQLPPCLSCSLRLTSKIAGPGAVSSTRNGLSVSENTTVNLSVNGINYNLVESYLVFPGAHKLPGRQSPCDAEYLLYFNNSLYARETGIVLCLPIDIGPGPGTDYFKRLDTTVRNDRPTLATILPPDAQYMSYLGADLKGRSKSDARPRAVCEPVKRVVSYYVALTPARIEAPDYQRLRSLQSPDDYAGPPVPLTDTMKARILKLATLVPALKCDAKTSAKDPGVATKALKCYRVDKDKNIINNKVSVGDQAPPNTTLEDELNRKEDLSEAPSAIQPGDVEYVIGIILGVLAGICGAALIAFYLWKRTFSGYLARVSGPTLPAGPAIPGLPGVPGVPSLSSMPKVSPMAWLVAGVGIGAFLLGILIRSVV